MLDWVKNRLGLEIKNYGEFYVYGLEDPRYDPPRVFYIGKGSHDRMYFHEQETRRLLKRGTPAAMMAMHCKHKRIVEILDAGFDHVPVVVLFRTDDESDAFRVERGHIERIGIERLTNETYGYSDKAIARLIRKQQRRYQ